MDYECPYCGHEEEYQGDGIGDGEQEEIQCEKCEKSYIIVACVSVTYDSYVADCLNGSPHNLHSRSHPRVAMGKVTLSCDDCNHREQRDATPEEIAEHGDFTFK
jgi:hypothetical protein